MRHPVKCQQSRCPASARTPKSATRSTSRRCVVLKPLQAWPSDSCHRHCSRAWLCLPVIRLIPLRLPERGWRQRQWPGCCKLWHMWVLEGFALLIIILINYAITLSLVFHVLLALFAYSTSHCSSLYHLTINYYIWFELCVKWLIPCFYIHFFSNTSNGTPVQAISMTPVSQVVFQPEYSPPSYDLLYLEPVEGASNAAFYDEKSAMPE
jgi:hypothetical protein